MRSPEPKGRKGVLFIQEAAGRNGAAMQLLHFLRWFKENANRPSSLGLSLDGPISREFRDVTDVWIKERSRWCPGGLRSVVMRSLGFERLARFCERSEFHNFAERSSPALVYANAFTASHSHFINMLDSRLPMVTHVHEFGNLLVRQGRSDTPSLLSRTRRFIACSGAVKQSLMHNQGVPSEKIDVIYESIQVANVRAGQSRQEVLAELGFPQDAFLIVGSGRVAWNKGADVFLQLARVVCARHPRARFAWIGPGCGWQISELQHDARMVGLSEKVRFTDEVAKPYDYFSAGDIFALTSREDSFPLTCLESAALGKPILCFADGGGMPEFVEDDCGFVVPYLDIDTMANRVVQLLDCPGCRKKMGEAARRKVAQRHDVSVSAPRILDVIERTITESR